MTDDLCPMCCRPMPEAKATGRPRLWCSDTCRKAARGRTPAELEANRTWAKGSGRLPVSAATFNDHLARNHAGEVEIRRRRGYDGWTGLGLLAGTDTAGDDT